MSRHASLLPRHALPHRGSRLLAWACTLQPLEPRIFLSGDSPEIKPVSRVFNLNTPIHLGVPDLLYSRALHRNGGTGITTDFFSAYVDPEGDPLQAIMITGSPQGSLSLAVEGITRRVYSGEIISRDEIPFLTYNPRTDFTGFEFLYWQASDGTSFSEPRPFTIANAAPSVEDFSVSGYQDLSITLDG